MVHLSVVITIILSILSDPGSSKPVHFSPLASSLIIHDNRTDHGSTPTMLHSIAGTGVGRTGTIHCWGEKGTPPHVRFTSVTHAACRGLIHSLLIPPLPPPMSYLPRLPYPSWDRHNDHCRAWLTPFPSTTDNSDPISRQQMHRLLGDLLRGCTSPRHPDQGGFISVQNGAWGLNLVAYTHLPEAVGGPVRNSSDFDLI